MRQKLGKPATLDLRRLFFSPRSQVRLRRAARWVHAREDFGARPEHVALCTAAAAPGGLPRLAARRLHAAVERAQSRQADWRSQTGYQERRSLSADLEF